MFNGIFLIANIMKIGLLDHTGILFFWHWMLFGTILFLTQWS